MAQLGMAQLGMAQCGMALLGAGLLGAGLPAAAQERGDSEGAGRVAALLRNNPGGGAALQSGITRLLNDSAEAAPAVIAAAARADISAAARVALVNGYLAWATSAFARNPARLAAAVQALLVGAPGTAAAVLAAAGNASGATLNAIAAGFVQARNQLAAAGNAAGVQQLAQAAAADTDPAVTAALTTAGNVAGSSPGAQAGAFQASGSTAN